MAQLTAVEWLLEAIGYKQESNITTTINIHPDCDVSDLVERAKQIEKEQIVKAWELRATPYPTEGMGYSIIDATGEQYYNQTYGENKD